MGALDCPGVTGGDGAQVATAWAVDSLNASRDSAIFVVRYVQLGLLSQADSGNRFEAQDMTILDTFRLVRRRYGWRISGTHDLPYLLPAIAFARWHLAPADSAALAAALRTSHRGV
jgi:hypothetical protein